MKTEKDKPVAWLNKSRNLLSWDKLYEDMDALYTHPKEWVGLTVDQMTAIAEWQLSSHRPLIDVIKAVEQALKEKNT